MSSIRWIAVFLASFCLIGWALSCSSSDPEDELSYDCDGDVHTNQISASPWVADNTEIKSYRYESNPEEDVVVLDLLDDSDASLGILTIQGFFASADDFTKVVETTFERDGEEPLEMISDAVVSNDHVDEFRTRTQFSRGNTQVLVRSDFQSLECYANEPAAGGEDGHPCAQPVPVFESQYSVPSCGFDVAPTLSSSPNLRAVEYRTPADADPGVGGFLMNVEQSYASFDAVGEGTRVSDAAEVDAWLTASGAGEIIGSDAEQLASAAYVDPTWMDHVEAHALECANEQMAGELQTVRQPHGLEELSCEPGQGLSALSVGDDIGVVQQPGGAGTCEDCADGCGKPHMRTFDGSSFPFHAAGEFVLATAEYGAPYTIQMRTIPAAEFSCRDEVEACQNITVISAVAMEIGDVAIGVYSDREPHLVIDGEPVERVAEADLSGLPAGATIHQRGEDRFRFGWPGGEALDVGVRDHHLDLHGTLPKTRFGQVAGIWGNYTNISGDDFKTRDGRIIEKPYTFDEFYDEFAASWRIDSGESLFDYGDGESTDGFVIDGLPDEDVSVDDLPAELRADAEEACRNVTGHPDRDWCIFDVVCMCDDDIAESTDHLGPHDSITDMDPDDPITANGDVCLGSPDSFEYVAAGEASCPPGVDDCIHLVREQAGVELAGQLLVNVTEPGVFAVEEAIGESQIPAGTEVNSYLLHLNETPEGTGQLSGTALFSGEILGVIVTDDALSVTDSAVGLVDATFADSGRQIDFETDQFEILPDQTGLNVAFESESGISEIRVITAAGQ